MKTIEATGNTLDEAWQKINAKAIKIAETETIVFKDLRKYGNFEIGYKMVFEYETKCS